MKRKEVRDWREENSPGFDQPWWKGGDFLYKPQHFAELQ